MFRNIVECDLTIAFWGRSGHDRMVVGFSTTCAISAYYHQSSNPVHSMQHYVIIIATGWWFSPGTPVSSINKTDRHNITEILLKVALNTINHTVAFLIALSKTGHL